MSCVVISGRSLKQQSLCEDLAESDSIRTVIVAQFHGWSPGTRIKQLIAAFSFLKYSQYNCTALTVNYKNKYDT